MSLPEPARLRSLDVFRGLTIAGMILVNNPGTWGAIYAPFEHAEWHGLTPTDLVFPFFLFIVGVSIALALGRRVERGGSQRDLYLKITRRTLIIFGLGLVLGGFPEYDLSTIRIPGVLQRIAVCYFIVSLIFLRILPNSVGPLLVSATLEMAYAIITESGLSYLGFGIQPPTPSWGNILESAQIHVYRAPWLAVFPGLMIFITVMAINFIGDGLRDAFDPYVIHTEK